MKWFKYLLAILAALLIILLVMWNRDKIFTLDVSTEVVGFTLADDVLSEWSIGQAKLIDDPFASDQQGRALDEDTRLIMATGTQVMIQRHGIERVRIRLSREDQRSVGHLEDVEGKVIELGGWALLLVESGSKPLVLPFRGTLIAGDDVTIGVDSILLSGTVSVVEEQLIGKTHYIAGVEQLNPGDRVQLFSHNGSKGSKEATVSGFIRSEPKAGFSGPHNALSLVAHGQAEYVQVERLGSAGYRIRAPRWARFLYDPLLISSIAIGTLLLILLDFILKMVEIFNNEPKRKKNASNKRLSDKAKGN